MTINHSTTLSQLKATVALIAAIIICMTAQAQQTHGCTSLCGRVIGLMPVTPCDTLPSHCHTQASPRTPAGDMAR